MILPYAGTLLIADPFLDDPNFMRTVVCLCEHNNEGSFGLVLSSKTQYTVEKVVPEFEGCTLPVYLGGPVQKDTLHFLHQYPELISDSIQIGENVFWGGNFEAVSVLIKTSKLHQDKIKFFAGYSGWSAGQLQGELDEKSWLTVQADEHLVFNKSEKDIWGQSLKKMGGQYEQLINYPLNPQLN